METLNTNQQDIFLEERLRYEEEHGLEHTEFVYPDGPGYKGGSGGGSGGGNSSQDGGRSAGEYYSDDGRYTHGDSSQHNGNWGKHSDGGDRGEQYDTYDYGSASGQQETCTLDDAGSLGGY